MLLDFGFSPSIIGAIMFVLVCELYLLDFVVLHIIISVILSSDNDLLVKHLLLKSLKVLSYSHCKQTR